MKNQEVRQFESSEYWRILCTKQAVIARSHLYKTIRQFFESRNVLEVETPVLNESTGTDPYIDSFEVINPYDKTSNKMYLQTSPEFAMKRLLCSGLGSIFQICKSFRAEQIGKQHNIEFTMLEWYQIGYNVDNLMTEMTELLSFIFNLTEDNSTRITYTELFIKYLNFDHNRVDSNFLKNKLIELFDQQFNNIVTDPNFAMLYSKDDLLMILMSHYIEPRLEKNKLTFIYDFPVTQSALARIDANGQYPVAKRFELYYNGFELANGFYELADHKEQAKRFENDLNKRKSLGLPQVAKDERLLQALAHGLPECSGVALGLDRVLMSVLGVKRIDDVITFRL